MLGSSSITTDSVISRPSWPGAMPGRGEAGRDELAAGPASPSCTRREVDADEIGGAPGRVAFQRGRVGGRPRAITNRPSSMIGPVSSAIDDERHRREQAARRVLASARSPRRPRSRRRRARRSAGSGGRTRRARARRAGRPRSAGGRASAARISSSNSSTRPRPDAFARYSAVSASRIASAAESPPLRTATPTLAPGSGGPSVATAARSRRSASASASSAPVSASATTANSSPPSGRRCRRAGASRSGCSATAISIASPVGWPYVSFTSLNRSRSTHSTPTSVRCGPRAPAPASAGRAAASGSGCR